MSLLNVAGELPGKPLPEALQPIIMHEHLKLRELPVEEYAALLRSDYCSHRPPPQWPPKLMKVFTNLALIKHDRLPSPDSLGDFEKTTLHGTVDDLCFKKYSIKLDQLLKPDSFFLKKEENLKHQEDTYSKQLIRCLNVSAQIPDSLKKRFNIPVDDGKDLPSSDELRSVLKQPGFLQGPRLRKLLLPSKSETAAEAESPNPSLDESVPPDDQCDLRVLIDGAPGVGKTTLTWKISKKWAKGKMLKQHKLVIRVSLRDLPDEPEGIWQLLTLGSEELKRSVEKELLDRNGKDTLFILDGWDELSPAQRKRGSILYKLVQGDLLSQSAVIITSRPYTSRALQLPDLVPRHIELFGFTQDQIKSCIQSQFISSPKSAQRLIQLLEVRIDILQLCYIPNNLSIIAYIFHTSKSSLPATLTQLYELYVHNAMVRYMQGQCEDPEVSLSYDSLSDFPPDVVKLYESLCSLALSGLEKSKMVFKDYEIKDLSPLLVEGANTLGLMTAYKSFTPRGIGRSFQFIHTTIQEFLAAEALARLPPNQQWEFMLEHFNDPKFRMVLSFLAGRSGLQHFKSMFQVPVSLAGHLNVDRLLLLVRMLYEAQNTELCHMLAHNFPDDSFQLSKFISLHMHSITELDLYMLRYFLHHSSHVWKTLDAHESSLSQILDAFKPSSMGVAIRELHINDTTTDVYKTLLDPVFKSLEAVRASVKTPFSEHACYFMSCHPLTHLHFDCHNQDSVESAMLAASKCQTLQYIGLTTVRHDRNGMKELHLSGVLKFPQIRSKKFCFKCENLVLTDEFAISLCHELTTSDCFDQLLLKNCTVNAHQLELLFTAIQSNSTLQVFHVRQLSTMQWNNEAALALTEMVEKNATITSLQLSISSDFAVSIGRALENNHSLISVDLSHNRSISDSISYILKGLQISASQALENSLTSTIQILVLQSCGLKDTAMKSVAQFLSSSCCTLKQLDMSCNSIKQEGSDVLFAAIATNTTLVTLNLDGNPLWLSNGDQIRSMLTKNSTLQELHLLSGLHMPAIEELANGLTKNSTVETLKLGVSLRSTPVKGAHLLFKALKTNIGLKNLLLAAYTLDVQGIEFAAEAFEQNSTLVSLHLQSCKFGYSDSSIKHLIASLYSHKSLSKLAIPITEKAFKVIFSEYDRINHYRAVRQLPYLCVIESKLPSEDKALLSN